MGTILEGNPSNTLLAYAEHSNSGLQAYVVLILHDFVVVKVKPSNQSPQKSSISYDCMGPRDPFAGESYYNISILELWRHGGSVAVFDVS